MPLPFVFTSARCPSNPTRLFALFFSLLGQARPPPPFRINHAHTDWPRIVNNPSLPRRRLAGVLSMGSSLLPLVLTRLQALLVWLTAAKYSNSPMERYTRHGMWDAIPRFLAILVPMLLYNPVSYMAGGVSVRFSFPLLFLFNAVRPPSFITPRAAITPSSCAPPPPLILATHPAYAACVCPSFTSFRSAFSALRCRAAVCRCQTCRTFPARGVKGTCWGSCARWHPGCIRRLLS